MYKEKSDVIAAISTPIGRGAISCVRLSGEGSADIVKKLTSAKEEFTHAKLISCIFKGRISDRIMAVVFYGGKSYTGEESAELYFHGGTYLTEQALLSVIDAGARLAEAGEFTRRAFLNGKIDLTQAEGISDLIDGDSIVGLNDAFGQSEGSTRRAIDNIYNALVETAAKAEVCIDYPEEDIEEQTREQLHDDIQKTIQSIKKEIDGYNGGRIRREGIKVTLTGKTNAGKSTLFNTLLQSERAIVSDEEGTTRDTIEEKFVYKGAAFVLTDTAGIRETDSKVEKLGIQRSVDALQKADVKILVVREGEKYPVDSLDENTVLVLNCLNTLKSSDIAIALNAKTGEGVGSLKEELYNRQQQKISSGGCINNPRQYEALKNAHESLIRSLDAVRTLTLDCVCADLREALDSLGSITGKNSSEAVIHEIFSRFCVGK